MILARAVLAPGLFSFALCLVHGDVLSAAGPKDGRQGNGYFGVALGFTYVAGNMALSSVSGGVFNPAIGVALWLAQGIAGKGFGLGSVLYYVIAPPVGGMVAERIIAYQASGKLSA